MNDLRDFINSKKLKINYIDSKLNIVNFDDIILLTESKIIFKTIDSTIVIKGNDLTLLKLLDREVLIGGIIKSIEL